MTAGQPAPSLEDVVREQVGRVVTNALMTGVPSEGIMRRALAAILAAAEPPAPTGGGIASEDRFQHVDGTDVLEFAPRYKPGTPVTGADTLVVTIGGGRSALLERAVVEDMHAWLGRWLAVGWAGTPRRCGRYFDEGGCRWQCTQTPGHTAGHSGPPVGWRTETGKPGPRTWAK